MCVDRLLIFIYCLLIHMSICQSILTAHLEQGNYCATPLFSRKMLHTVHFYTLNKGITVQHLYFQEKCCILYIFTHCNIVFTYKAQAQHHSLPN